jgi:glycosyltransferase involved in cell wall biosynthesis
VSNSIVIPRKAVIFVDHSTCLGGANKVLSVHIDKMGEFGRPVFVCPDNSPITSIYRNKGIKVVTTKMPWFMKTANIRTILSYPLVLLRFTGFLKKLIVNENAGLIYANTFIAALYCSLLARLTKIPLVWHMHDIIDTGLVNRIFVRYAALGTDRIICVSDAVRTSLIKFGVQANKCCLIHNCYIDPVDASVAESDFRGEFHIDKDAPLIGMFGNISPGKGQIILLQAAADIVRQFPKACFVIVGSVITENDQEYEKQLKAFVTKHGLESSVILTGFRTDVQPIMKSSDIVVHSASLPESMPLVILEAMHAEKPVVASCIGGIPEVVKDGITGLLVEPGNAESLARAICRLLQNPDERRRMGCAGQKRLLENFREDIFLESLRVVYREILPPVFHEPFNMSDNR